MPGFLELCSIIFILALLDQKINWKLEVVICRERKTRGPGLKTLKAQERTKKQIYSHTRASPGIEPGQVGERQVLHAY